MGSFNVTKAKLLIADDGPGKKKPAFSFQATKAGYLDIDRSFFFMSGANTMARVEYPNVS